MALSKLDTFILFHLFKVPALLAAAGIAALLCSEKLMVQASDCSKLAQEKQSIDQVSLDAYGHLLNTNSTLADVIKARGLQAIITSSDPLQVETDLETMKKLEKLGIFCTEASFASNELKATITYPPKIK
jgi:hypothetical protein